MRGWPRIEQVCAMVQHVQQKHSPKSPIHRRWAVSVYIYICTYMYIYICILMPIYGHVWAHVWTCMYEHIWLYLRIYDHTLTYMGAFLFNNALFSSIFIDDACCLVMRSENDHLNAMCPFSLFLSLCYQFRSVYDMAVDIEKPYLNIQTKPVWLGTSYTWTSMCVSIWHRFSIFVRRFRVDWRQLVVKCHGSLLHNWALECKNTSEMLPISILKPIIFVAYGSPQIALLVWICSKQLFL